MRGLHQGRTVGVEQQEEDHGHRHDVHVEEQNDAAVVEAPLEAQAAHGVEGAGESDSRRDEKPRIGMQVGKSSEEEGAEQTPEDKDRATQQRFSPEVQEPGRVDPEVKRGGDDFFSLAEAAEVRGIASRYMKRPWGTKWGGPRGPFQSHFSRKRCG